MSDGGGDDVRVVLEEVAFAFKFAERFGDVLSDAGFLCDDEGFCHGLRWPFRVRAGGERREGARKLRILQPMNF